MREVEGASVSFWNIFKIDVRCQRWEDFVWPENHDFGNHVWVCAAFCDVPDCMEGKASADELNVL